MRSRFLVALVAGLTTLSPATVLRTAAPAAAVLPVSTADLCGGVTFHPGAVPNYTVTGMSGIVTSLSGNPVDGFAFTFDNPFPDGANYNFSLQLYGFDGSPLYYAPSDTQGGLAIMTGSQPGYQLFGTQGSVWTEIPQEFQGQTGSVKLMVNVTSADGRMGTNGWASGASGASGTAPAETSDGSSSGC
jgi:hypothetical protein